MTRKFRFAFLASLLAIAIYPRLSSAALVAQYDFEGNVNDTTTAYHGTFNGGTAVYGAGRLAGQSIDLDGIDDFIATTSNSNLGLTGSFSVLAWVYADVLTTGGCCAHDYTILGNEAPNANNEQLHLVVRSQQQHLGFFGDDLGPSGVVTPGHWYHLAWTYDATSNQQAMYLNGSPNGTRVSNNDFLNGAKTANIGKWNGGSFWNGWIDQLKIYDNALTSAQVSSEAATTIVKYQFDGNVNDASGNDYHGTVNGTAQYGTGLSSGSSFDFDGATYVSTGQEPMALGLTGAGWTASARINADTLTGDRAVFGQDGGASNQTLHLIVRNNNDTGNVPRFWFGQYSNDSGGGRQLETGHSYQVDWRFDNGEQAIFVNGVLESSSGGHAALANSANNVLVGRWGGASYFDGRIDDATIQNSAASVASIQADAALNIPASERFSATLAGGLSVGMRARKVNGAAGDIDGSQSNLAGGSLPGDGVGLFSTVNMSNAGQGLFAGGTDFPGGGGDNFSTEVTGLLYVPTPGIYVLGTRSDDSARIQIGRSLLTLDEFRGDAGDAIVQRTVNFAEAGYYPYRIIHREAGGNEHLEFFSGANTAGAIDAGGGFTDLINDTTNGGMLSIATGSFLVRTASLVGYTGATNLDRANNALAGGPTSSTFSGVVNFWDGEGGTGNFGNAVANFPNSLTTDFAVEATAKIWITEAGTYTFGTNNDDGVQLFINGMPVITDNGAHATQDFFGSIILGVGFHDLRMVYYEFSGGGSVELFAAKGNFNSFGAAPFRLIGDVGNGGIAAFVPEPAAFLLLAIAAPALVRCGRKR